MQLRLNPALRPEPFAEIYARDTRVQVPNLFPPDVADTIEATLLKATPWRIIYSNADGKHAYLSIDEAQRESAAVSQQRMETLYAQAQEGFAYIYFGFPMLEAYIARQGEPALLMQMMDFLNSPEFLGFAKAVVGEPTVIKADAQATYYAPGHFLTKHDDSGANAERRAAYVLGFTRQWRADWGGQLLFYDKDERTIAGFKPSFNTLNLFRTPQDHAVTCVSPFAGAARLSITGWLRDDPAPAR
jgi:SM-20-related protein